MEAVLTFVFNLYLASVGISACVKLAKDYFANKKINKKGYNITKGDREIQEVVYDYLKENFYILVPIRNIKKSWKLIWSNNKKYSEERFNKLKEQGRLEKIEEIVGEAVEESKPIKKEEKKPKQEEKPVVTNDVKKNNQLIVDEYIAEINNSTNVEFISALKSTYRQKSLELRERHAKLKDMVATSTNEEFKKKLKKEMSAIARRVNAYDKIFVAARDRLFELKQKNQSTQRKK